MLYLQTRRIAAAQLIVLVSLLTAACGLLPATGPASDHCRQTFEVFDATVRSHGVGDAQAARIPGFPHLRTNRPLASLAEDLRARNTDSARLEAWISEMWSLGDAAVQVELANLPPAARNRMTDTSGKPITSFSLAACAAELARADAQDPARRQQLLNSVSVPDAYSTVARASGAYYLARFPALRAVGKWHDEMRGRFGRVDLRSRKKLKLPPRARERLDRDSVRRIMDAARARHPLGLPLPEKAELDRLLQHFAPTLHLEIATASDLVGEIGFRKNGDIEVGISRPAAYTLASWTRWRGQTLLQLSWHFWFPRRPAEGMLDPYAGLLDGLIWRVTLAADGSVLAYDSIHPCGCYYTLYRDRHSPAARESGFNEEPVLVFPKTLPDPYRHRLELEISPIDHQVIDVQPWQEEVPDEDRDRLQNYRFLDYNALRSLPVGEETRASLFDPKGLVPGTERGERRYLWPLGVISPGQMRQWGHHAVVFVGRRHFDDAFLFEELLMPR